MRSIDLIVVHCSATQTRHEQLIGTHARSYNSHSLGVCYEGGLDKEGTAADLTDIMLS